MCIRKGQDPRFQNSLVRMLGTQKTEHGAVLISNVRRPKLEENKGSPQLVKSLCFHKKIFGLTYCMN